jgi:hypothetical protein
VGTRSGRHACAVRLGRGIHPQDDTFPSREIWDLSSTPRTDFPLLLHYHPLVIYRYQVLKQADIVLAIFLLGDEFSLDKRRNFDYHDPLTTGDSSLSYLVDEAAALTITIRGEPHLLNPGAPRCDQALAAVTPAAGAQLTWCSRPCRRSRARPGPG